MMPFCLCRGQNAEHAGLGEDAGLRRAREVADTHDAAIVHASSAVQLDAHPLAGRKLGRAHVPHGAVLPIPVQPAHVVEPVVATPAVAPVAIAAYPYAHHYGAYGAYPAYAHAAYAGAYAGYPYAGAYGPPAYTFGGYPYALPVAAAKAE